VAAFVSTETAVSGWGVGGTVVSEPGSIELVVDGCDVAPSSVFGSWCIFKDKGTGLFGWD